MATELPLKLPKLVSVDDYHEFLHIQDRLRDLTGSKRVKVKEVAQDFETAEWTLGQEKYIGIVYTRKDADYRRLVKKVKEWT